MFEKASCGSVSRGVGNLSGILHESERWSLEGHGGKGVLSVGIEASEKRASGLYTESQGQWDGGGKTMPTLRMLL